MLKGEQAPAPGLDDLPIETAESLFKKPVPVEYNPAFPIEEFDFIITDECHRSIYNLWRQVLEYFDASLIGLTATPSKQIFGFFQQNLVVEPSGARWTGRETCPPRRRRESWGLVEGRALIFGKG
jgi:type I restriction enzyme R subunit